ncbi:UDP-N-acetylglucosamine 2-epimerase (non-hydrolyzing) [bacterium]|nr:UDP-N-acetylglucosamine 2-epimerase (non-hydrolyzing) [bacterium]
MKISIVFGARPTFIKMSPLIKECRRKHLDYFLIHTGQHYSPSLDKIFFEKLKIPRPKYNLGVGSGTHSQQMAKLLVRTEKVFLQEKPDLVLISGDTNSIAGAALVAAKLYLPLIHIEAGLRSFDRRMPEEVNRVIADHLSDFLFAPTSAARDNLLQEGIKRNRIFVVGNIIVDAVKQNIKIARDTSDVLSRLRLSPRKFFLVTAHRQENVDSKKRFQGILRGLELVFRKFQLPIIYPIHPRSRKRLKQFRLKVPSGVKVIPPLDYWDFLLLESSAALVLTDSGGIQEETCILRVPCVTLRDNTERPETLEVGSNIIVGTNPQKIVRGVQKMINKRRQWANPFGKGNTASLILDIIYHKIKKEILLKSRECWYNKR